MHAECVWNISTSYPNPEIWLQKGSWQQYGSDCKPKQVKICTNRTYLAQYIFCEQGKVYLPFCLRMQCICFSFLICEDIHHTDKCKPSFLPTWKSVFVLHYAEGGCLSSYHETCRCQKVVIMLFLYSPGAWRKISENKWRNQQQYFVVGYSPNTNPHLRWNLANQISQGFLYI